MKRILTPLFVSAALIMTTGVANAADAAAGKAKAVACAACHGANGISPNPTWPNLAGQKAAYTAKQIRAFKDGSRKDPMMSGMAAGIQAADIDNIAAYYESL